MYVCMYVCMHPGNGAKDSSSFLLVSACPPLWMHREFKARPGHVPMTYIDRREEGGERVRVCERGREGGRER